MKFTYLDKVEVISGFYKGLKGNVYKYDEINCTYYIIMEGVINHVKATAEDWVYHRELRGIK